MRAPAFWWSASPSLLARALAPAGFVWGAVSAGRMARAGASAGVPVLCVGNFVAGGAGKTPVALTCARLLRQLGWSPAFLTRGYGGTFSRAANPVRIDPRRHTAREAGDEPLLLARVAPTFVAGDRVAGAHAAVAMGAQALVMDDGLQNPSLAKNCVLAVLDGETGVGNGLCIPAGPLRAPLANQIAAADALVLMGRGEPGETLAVRMRAAGKPVFAARLEPDPAAAARLRGRKVVAFAGIGRPEKFFASLESVGAIVADAFAFADHQMLEPKEVATLQAAASALDAQLVTTEKDFVRVGHLFGPAAPDVLPVNLVFEAERDVAEFLSLMLRRQER